MQGSPWTNNISLAILNFHESGVMEELETTWIDSKNCAEQSNSPATLGLSHMLGRKLLKVPNESFVTLIESPTKTMKWFHNALPLVSIWIKSHYCFPCLEVFLKQQQQQKKQISHPAHIKFRKIRFRKPNDHCTNLWSSFTFTDTWNKCILPSLEILKRSNQSFVRVYENNGPCFYWKRKLPHGWRFLPF